MKQVVSVSLGTSKRDKRAETCLLDIPIMVERRGADGNHDTFKRLVAELDGKIDCFGVGGTDAYLYAGNRRYAFRQTLDLMKGAIKTPWVDGSGLKHTLERETVGWLQDEGVVDFATKRVLLMSAVDRFGMGEALSTRAKSMVYGDLLFGLGIPVPLRSWSAVLALGRMILPIITRMPVEMLYPTGEKQEINTPKYIKHFADADVIAGDWHIIRRYMPEDLRGKIILTTSSRAAETELLRARGVHKLITTTPSIDGESFATNVMEAALVAILGKSPAELTPADYLGTLRKLGWKPSVVDLNPA